MRGAETWRIAAELLGHPPVGSYSYLMDLALQYIADQDMDGWLTHAPKGLAEEFCRWGLLTRDIDGAWAFTAWGKAELRRRGWRAPWWTWRGLAKRVLRWREARAQ